MCVFLSLPERKRKVIAKFFASSSVSINHALVTVNLVPVKISGHVLLANLL